MTEAQPTGEEQPTATDEALDAGIAEDNSETLCRADKVLCRRAAPRCDEGDVPSVVGTCWGDCVAIEDCSCAEAADCPQQEKFTCWVGRGHCNYYGP